MRTSGRLTYRWPTRADRTTDIVIEGLEPCLGLFGVAADGST